MLQKVKRKLITILKPFFIRNKSQKLDQILKNINLKNFKTIIVFENKFGFQNIMKQRPQQIASNFPSDVLFIYHSNKDHYDNWLEYQFLKDNLLLINLDFYRKSLMKKLVGYKNKYLMIYSTNYIERQIVQSYRKQKFTLIYEYVDNIDPELNGKKLARKLQEQFDCVVHQNHVFISTTATKLYENVRNVNPNAKVKLITNGVDYEHFKVQKTSLPKDLAKIKKEGGTIVGYYGALANWFDYDLIKKIAENKTYRIVLIGLEYDDSLMNSGILKYDNVYYLGKKEYQELPRYTSGFDICIIPFLINDITLSTSPVKVFEYMASGKPIVTTALPECMKYQSVLTSKTYTEFLTNLEKAITLAKDKNYLSLLKKEAMENKWSSKCKDMLEFIKEK